MAAETCHICVIILFLGPIRRLLLPKMSQPVLAFSDISVWKLAIYLIFLCASVLVLTPLEVIATRLAIQRNHASAEYNSVAQEVMAMLMILLSTRSGRGCNRVRRIGLNMPQVIQTFYTRLRHEGDPYLGLVEIRKENNRRGRSNGSISCVVDNSPCGTGQYIRMITNFSVSNCVTFEAHWTV